VRFHCAITILLHAFQVVTSVMSQLHSQQGRLRMVFGWTGISPHVFSICGNSTVILFDAAMCRSTRCDTPCRCLCFLINEGLESARTKKHQRQIPYFSTSPLMAAARTAPTAGILVIFPLGGVNSALTTADPLVSRI